MDQRADPAQIDTGPIVFHPMALSPVDVEHAAHHQSMLAQIAGAPADVHDLLAATRRMFAGITDDHEPVFIMSTAMWRQLDRVAKRLEQGKPLRDSRGYRRHIRKTKAAETKRRL